MSDCTVRDNLIKAMKESMRNRDKARLATVRLALAEFKRVEMDERAVSGSAESSLDDVRAPGDSGQNGEATSRLHCSI